jgi:DNA (cytosine-5)-methyltransferase 1
VDSIGLFAGIGGFEPGMEHIGTKPILFSEIEPSAQNVLKNWKPAVPIEHDVRDMVSLPRARILCAGFSCQDLSQAGHKAGITGPKSSLIQHVFRLLRDRPIDYLVIENVPFMLDLQDGTGIQAVTSGLEELRYRWSYRVVDSRFLGTSQRRRRVFLVACLDDDPRRILLADNAPMPAPVRADEVDASAEAIGFYWTEGRGGLGLAVNGTPPLKAGSTIGIPSPPAILLPNGTLGTPDIRDAERLQGLPEDWTEPGGGFSKNGRWRLVGNAVTLNVARWIGERIVDPGSYDASSDEPVYSTGRYPRAAWNMGNGVFAADKVTENPLDIPMPRIGAFLRHPLQPLSARATAGFLKRARSGSLRFPKHFLERVQAHLDAMNGPSLFAT